MNDDLSRLDILDGLGRMHGPTINKAAVSRALGVKPLPVPDREATAERARRQNKLRRTPVVGGPLSFSDLTEAYPMTLLDVNDPYKRLVSYDEPYPVSGDLTAKYESRSHRPWPMLNLWTQPGIYADDSAELGTYRTLAEQRRAWYEYGRRMRENPQIAFPGSEHYR